MEAREPVVRQMRITLAYFEQELPALYLADGRAYVPVIALCQMLGLHAATHMARWRRLVIWNHTRKLPLQTARGTRLVWCLHLGAVPLLYSCFNWSLVSPERRGQLRQATDASLKALEQVQQEMLLRYRQLRRHLLKFLVTYAHADSQLDQVAQRMQARLDRDSCLQFEVLLSQGRTLIQQATAHARKLVQEQATDLIADVVTVDADGQMTQIGSFPLFPVVSRQDEERFSAYLGGLTHWYHRCSRFWTSKVSSATTPTKKNTRAGTVCFSATEHLEKDTAERRKEHVQRPL